MTTLTDIFILSVEFFPETDKEDRGVLNAFTSVELAKKEIAGRVHLQNLMWRGSDHFWVTDIAVFAGSTTVRYRIYPRVLIGE